jgi:divalent metal cation (Fe/Co/Zn/Cd) transporter
MSTSADRTHPFGHGQEKYFWALVSAVSVFFVGCGLNIYHGVHALLQRAPVEPFTPLVLGLLLFAFALESFTLVVAMREIGGWKGLSANRHNTTVLAVVLEDAVALLGILLTLVVAGVSFAWGPHAVFDAAVAIAVGALLGVMALFLASINRRLLIDTSDAGLDRAAQRFLEEQGVAAEASSVVVDDDHAVVFLRALPGSARPFDTSDSYALGEALKAQLLATAGKTIDEVYWKFPLAAPPPGTASGR